MPPTWQRLVRFLATDGRTYYGDAVLPRGTTDIGKARQAKLIKGSPFQKYTVTNEVMVSLDIISSLRQFLTRQDIRKLLCPLAREDAGTVRCLGLNYEQHAKEVPLPFCLDPI